MRKLLKPAALLFLTFPMAALACEQQVILSEHLEVGDPGDYYLVEIQRVHGDNLVGTITRSFGATLVAGRSVSIQLVQSALADATCALEFAVGETWLLTARLIGGALQVSRYNSHNVPFGHERFSTYIKDIETAAATR